MSSPADAIIAAARSRIGDAYAWGGGGPDVFDCSGLVQWSYAQAGISIPRTSQQQAAAGQPVARGRLQPGDIIIYYPDASHCALYSGGGNVIEAATYGIPVQEVPIDAAGPYNTARRYLPTPGGPVTLFGPDLSNNNWNSAAEIQGWLDDCFHREGYSWMEHKVSEGNYYQDPFWPTVRDWCAHNGVPCIGYHYVTTDNPDSQVAQWVATGGGANAMLDFEANSGDITNFWAVVTAFNAAGVNIALSYIPHWYWSQIGFPDLSQVPGLISSSYYETGTYGSTEYEDAGGDTGPGWNPYGGATPVIWQFSDGALIGGKSVDANAFNGTPDQLNQLLGLGAPPVTDTPDYQKLTYEQLAGPVGADGYGTGWPQLGQNPDGTNRYLVDGVASLQASVNNISAMQSALLVQLAQLNTPKTRLRDRLGRFVKRSR